MTHREQILQDALALSPEDRAFVAAALEESLAEDVEGISAEQLLNELQRRSASYRAGTTRARSASDVLAEQRRRQAGETNM